MVSSAGKRIRESFDRRYPDLGLSELKKIDLVLWQLRPKVTSGAQPQSGPTEIPSRSVPEASESVEKLLSRHDFICLDYVQLR